LNSSQSIAIARSLTEHVKLICLDEPTAALGARQTAQVVRLVRSITASGTGVILVTHDLGTVRALADRIVVLSLGRVAYDGSARQLSADQLWGLMASGTLAPASEKASGSAAGSARRRVSAATAEVVGCRAQETTAATECMST
jgi:ABC-type sugar transport system ATPase subunit